MYREQIDRYFDLHKDEIVENIEPTAEIVCKIKPIYNFKAAE